MWKWVNDSGALSEPAPAWQQRTGGPTDAVAVAGDTLVVEHHISVEGRRVSDGTRIWSRKAD